MDKELTYDQAMEKLQAIVERLESGEDTLDDAVKLFEEGAKLSAFCYGKLKDAQQRVHTVTEKEDMPGEE